MAELRADSHRDHHADSRRDPGDWAADQADKVAAPVVAGTVALMRAMVLRSADATAARTSMADRKRAVPLAAEKSCSWSWPQRVTGEVERIHLDWRSDRKKVWQ